jgi:hypothetical protein
MAAKVRRDYYAVCSVDAPESVVTEVAETLAEAILQDEELKKLGINVSDLLGDLF